MVHPQSESPVPQSGMSCTRVDEISDFLLHQAQKHHNNHVFLYPASHFCCLFYLQNPLMLLHMLFLFHCFYLHLPIIRDSRLSDEFDRAIILPWCWMEWSMNRYPSENLHLPGCFPNEQFPEWKVLFLPSWEWYAGQGSIRCFRNR